MAACWIQLGDMSKSPIYRQISEQIRSRILLGELKAGEKMCSTRELAADLHVSRNAVIEAYEQLFAEGYLEGRPGSGTYVAEGASIAGLITDPRSRPAAAREQAGGSVTRIDFRTGIPLLESMPLGAMWKAARSAILDSQGALWGYGEPEGYPVMRRVLAPYLKSTRGVNCSPEQIIITTGALQAVSIITGMLVKRGDEITLEDPAHEYMQKIFQSRGAILCPVPVDRCGMMTQHLDESGNPKFIFTTPSHQFPLGSVLSIQRRLELIAYARQKNCFIVEDDYDSEFRYDGPPLSSLQGLDPERVIYVGTFSKVLSPAVRVGYMALPESLVQEARAAKMLADHHSSLLDQRIVADLIANGTLQSHISRMRKIYARKRETLAKLLKAYFPGIEISGQSTGLHIVAAFHGAAFTDDVVDAIQKTGVGVYPVEKHAIVKGKHLNELIFGYVNLTLDEMEEGLVKIKTILAGR